ncbi:MAG: hypothetical protein J6W67_05135, partial [Lentisphaeria bacterium]|nr:hypothetical protein [Lentisphaeria bacterium]
FTGPAGYFYTVHDGEFNMYFLDGHVETVSPEKAVSGKFVSDKGGTGAIAITENSHIKNYDD